jgi:hypothetical protein
MKLRLLGIVAALACTGASAAKADWEYTKWGMTPQQVIAASKNVAKEDSTDLSPDSDGNVTKVVAPFKAGKFPFRAEFGFDAADKLSSVTLVLYDKSAGLDTHLQLHGEAGAVADADLGICHDLDTAVNFAYGEPLYTGANHIYAIEKWVDEKSKNNVKYTALVEVGCYVQYSVIKPAGAR